ncbi:hypothetical protein K2173_011767 [Erythroxylum novogranatense]|uniref:Uncharacterized protein n=1 Tax=Erythroxylum novogranatense TaxID=1862640 RepID=A0AAV8TTD6_9ROSI|nr:hypothetical protein K2173_011767 [Erythroxylum novogranatense]
MNPLNKLVATIIVIFAVCLLVLVIQSIYVLWRQRRLRQVVTGSVRDVELSGEQLPSKELLYFFCCRSQKTTRVEPDRMLAAVEATPPPLMPSPTEEEDRSLKHKDRLHCLGVCLL